MQARSRSETNRNEEKPPATAVCSVECCDVSSKYLAIAAARPARPEPQPLTVCVQCSECRSLPSLVIFIRTLPPSPALLPIMDMIYPSVHTLLSVHILQKKRP